MSNFLVRKGQIGLQSKGSSLSRFMVSTALVAAGALCFSYPAIAADYELPSGGVVTNGSATIAASGVDKLDITQSTNRVVINWDSFNIGSDATVQFYQPSVNSLAVNKVSNDGQFSRIDGRLIANGHVMILDPNGVMFGSGSIVDVGGIIASTGDVDNNAVMSGASVLTLSNFGTGEIINEGTITAADSGLVAFVGPVVKNSGIITANLGRVALAAGNETATVDLYGDGLVSLAYTDKDQDLLSENTGTINAVGGKIHMTAAAAKAVVDSVVNMDGVAHASSASVTNGRIVLSAAKVKVGQNANVKANTTEITAKSVDLDATIDGAVEGSAQEVNILSDNAKIMQGMDIIDEYGTINVSEGIYNENVVVNVKGLTLNGAMAGVDAGDSDNRGVGESIISAVSRGISIWVDDVTVDGFTVDNTGRGIQVADADNAYIKNNIITNSSLEGIFVTGSDGTTIQDNLIQYTGEEGIQIGRSSNINLLANQIGVLDTKAYNIGRAGVFISSSDNVYLFKNRIANTNVNRDGIATEYTNNLTAERNVVYDVGRDAIHIIYGDNISLVKNDIDHVARHGIYGYTLSGLNVSLNDVLDAKSDGVHAERIAGYANIEGNIIDYSGQNGIRALNSENVSIVGNTVQHNGTNGIHVSDVNGMVNIEDNIVKISGENGILVDGYEPGMDVVEEPEAVVAAALYVGYVGGSLVVSGNNIDESDENGIFLNNIYGSVEVEDNYLDDSLENGIVVTNSDVDLLMSGNSVDDSGIDGIHFYNVYGSVDIVNSNVVTDSGDDGIYVGQSSSLDLLVEGNQISKSGDNGVYLDNISGDIVVSRNTIFLSRYGDGVRAVNVNNGYYAPAFASREAYDSINQLVIDGNDISYSGNNGVGLYNVGGLAYVTNNRITRSINDGVYAYNDSDSYYYNDDDYGDDYYDDYPSEQFFKSYYAYSNPIELYIEGNTIENASSGFGSAGLAAIELDIGSDGYVKIADNNMGSNFEYGLLAYSGTIDLTGDANTIHDTAIGMGFYPDEYGYDDESYFEYLSNRLRLVNDTIGATAFVDQADYFVDLGYGAFFAPGYPTLLDGTQATYQLGGSIISPSVTGFITSSEYAVLESMLFHYVDSQDRGLFFFNIIDEDTQQISSNIDNKDVFRNFSFSSPQGQGGSLIITGMPNVAGGNQNGAPTAFDPNSIEPAAGDEEGENTQNIAEVEPEAGETNNASCWYDATQSLGQGTPVMFNFGGGTEQLLQDAASCGDAQGAGQTL